MPPNTAIRTMPYTGNVSSLSLLSEVGAEVGAGVGSLHTNFSEPVVGKMQHVFNSRGNVQAAVVLVLLSGQHRLLGVIPIFAASHVAKLSVPSHFLSKVVYGIWLIVNE